VAIITALVVVTAATLAISGMLWRQSVALRKAENQAALDQARWLARSALEWSRLILLQDARTSSVDHYGEFWATPLAETRIADTSADATGTVDDGAAYISGRIVDAQARFNLTSLTIERNQAAAINQSGSANAAPASADRLDSATAAADAGSAPSINPRALATLARLVKVLGLPQALAVSITQRMLVQPHPADFDQLADELLRYGAASPEALATLRPFVVILPKPSAVNLNTAPAEVLAACFDDLKLDAARALADSRDHVYFNQLSDVDARVNAHLSEAAAPATLKADAAVATHYFEVDGHIRYGRAELDVVALVERDNNGTTRVLSLQER
jgi:general secretion pathway protein K